MTGFRAFGLRAALLVGALGGVAATNEAAAQTRISRMTSILLVRIGGIQA
jgi:hypothetical protein